LIIPGQFRSGDEYRSEDDGPACGDTGAVTQNNYWLKILAPIGGWIMQTYRFPARAVKVMPSISAFLAAVLGASPASSQAQQAPASAYPFQYSAKFVCGRVAASPANLPPVAPGFYYTAVNVHNPRIEGDIKLTKKFAIALPGEKAGPFSKFHDNFLKADQAMEIDCPDILKHLKEDLGVPQAPFVKGFVVIQSTGELDVVSVYTAATSPTTPVVTMAIERVPKRP
jgi:hypothetical protein